MERRIRALAIALAGAVALEAALERPAYLDPALSVDARVDDLLSRMTLEEKVGQMNTTLHGGPRQQALFLNELRDITGKTRLGIPLLQTEEGTHGLMCSGGTIFPEGLALGSTWDLALLDGVYAAAAREARAIGVHQIFTLVVEPNRDRRLGRNQEGCGGRSSPAPSRWGWAARAGRSTSRAASKCYPRDVRGAGRAIAAATDQPGRKVRTPKGSVLANGQRGRPQGECHRKHTAELAGATPRVARVKRCGKSAPPSW